MQVFFFFFFIHLQLFYYSVMKISTLNSHNALKDLGLEKFWTLKM